MKTTMGISRMLIGSNLEKLDTEYREFYHEVQRRQPENQAEVTSLIEKRVGQITRLIEKLDPQNVKLDEMDLSVLQLNCREFKLQYRVTRRRWQRLQTLASRTTRRFQDRRPNVTTFAA